MHAHFNRILAGIAVLSACPALLSAQPFTFTSVQPRFTEVDHGALGYADLDGDGDFDLVAAGNSSNLAPYVPTTFVAFSEGDRTQSNGAQVHDFDAIPMDFPVWHSDVAWLDYDRNGQLDFLLTGSRSSGATFENQPHRGEARIYANRATEGFQNIGAALGGIYGGAAAVGDFDNDGDEDVLLSGLRAPDVHEARLYENVENRYEPHGAEFAGLAFGDAQWVDYDGDGDLDLTLAGVGAAGDFVTNIYRNDGEAGFTDVDARLPGYAFTSFDWGDYDNDGDLDLVLAGAKVSLSDFLAPEADVYENRQGSFTALDAGIVSVMYGSVGWGDYDSDGDLDLLVIGGDDIYNGRVGYAYENDGGRFAARAAFPGVSASSATLGDYDADNDLDILVAGNNLSLHPLVRLYRNDGKIVNTPPEPPGDLRAEVSADEATLIWGAGSDEQTQAAGLTYNLYVRPVDGKDILSAKADKETGKRLIPGRGNVDQARRRTIRGLVNGNYYWSVQSVDHSFVGSAFADEGTFTITSGKDEDVTSMETDRPFEYALKPGYPNPFGDATRIEYTMRESGPVTLTVYNVLGARVRRLVGETRAAGTHRITWNGRDASGRPLGAGVYFVRMEAGGNTHVQRLMVVR